MTGSVDALALGSVLLDRNNRIVACCERFADLVQRSRCDLIMSRGWDLVVEEDRAFGRYFLNHLWRAGERLTLLSRLQMPSGRILLSESCVQRFSGGDEDMMLSLVRPFDTLCEGTETCDAACEAKADYVVDMAAQLARMAAQSVMPFTAELLRAASRLGLREGALTGHATTG